MDSFTKDFGVTKKLFEIPKKDKGLNMPHIQVFEPNDTHQADLLFLPDDEGFKYALVVVDTASGLTDAEPLNGKTAQITLDGFKSIYKRKILEMPKRLQVDSGTEFKGVAKKYFDNHGVAIRYGVPNRHRMQALVERRNQTIGKNLFMRMTAQELLTGEPSVEWIQDLPIVIEEMNKKQLKRKKKKEVETPVCDGESCGLLEVGTKVRVQLDEPIDATAGKRLHGHFRSTDIRWNPKERVIKELLIKPGFPPMYLLDGNEGKLKIQPVAYTRNQLQVIESNEEAPKPSVIRGKPKHYIVEEILKKKKVGRKIEYLVKWLGFPLDEATWVPRTQLLEDVPEIVKEYEAIKI